MLSKCESNVIISVQKLSAQIHVFLLLCNRTGIGALEPFRLS